MADVVVTVPRGRWAEWLEEGDLPGDEDLGELYDFYLWGAKPDIKPGERVYIVAHGRLRGYAPLVEIGRGWERGQFSLVRGGGAVACTIAEPIRGFRGWRYRFWDYADEVPFPEWREVDGAVLATDGLPLFAGVS